jgi:Xaa-Pro aminopeptidase
MCTNLRFAVFLCSVSALAAGTAEFQDRRQRAAAAFEDGILEVLAKPTADGSADGFRQDAAFYYFTGLENTAGAVLAIDGRSHESWLFLRPPGRRESSIAKLKGPPEGSPGSDPVKQTGIEHVADWSELAGYLEKNSASPAVLYYESVPFGPELPPNITTDPVAPLWAVTISRKWPTYQLRFANPRVSALMDVQSPSELVNVHAAAKATVQAVMAGMRAIRPGASQRTVELAVADACWKEGAHGVSFWPWGQGGTGWRLPGPLGFQNSL